jgi:DNA-binding NarL/FixJ family response regulator
MDIRAETVVAGGGHRRSKILVVEDEGLLAMQMQELLELSGFEVIEPVADGETAIRVAQALGPDLVVMDVRLAGPMDGVTAATEIWSRYGIRSLLVTGNTDVAGSPRGMAANPVGVLAKPYREADILAAIRAALPADRRS